MSVAGGRGLGTAILIILRRDSGRDPEALVELNGAPRKDVTAAIWSLYRARQICWCNGHVVIRPGTTTARRSA